MYMVVIITMMLTITVIIPKKKNAGCVWWYYLFSFISYCSEKHFFLVKQYFLRVTSFVCSVIC